MKKLSALIVGIVVLLALLAVPALPQVARADGPDGNILNYSVWGDSGVSLAQGTSINGGKLGSKGPIQGAHSDYVKDGVRGGGDFGVGNAFRTEESILVNGNVKMVYNGSVSGDVKAGGSISLGKGTDVGGFVVPSAGTPANPLPALPVIATPCTGNNDNRNVGSGLTLAPGTYGEVRWSVNTPGPLRLSEGKYVFKRFNGTNGARIEINLTNPGDDITICVEESMAGFGNSSKIVLTGAPSKDIYWQVQGEKAAFANGVTFVGTLFVPDGDISFGNSASVTGALYAGASSQGGTIKFGNGSEVNFALAQQFINLLDSTPPVITPHITGTLGNNGWYIGDVTVTWTVEDPESGIVSQSGSDPTTITTDTDGITLTCSATNGVGLSSSVSVTIKRDATLPIIIITQPADGAQYLIGAAVAADYTATDALLPGSGIDTITGTVPNGANFDTGSVGSKPFTVTAVDMAGNTASLTIHYNIYKIPVFSVFGSYINVNKSDVLSGLLGTYNGGDIRSTITAHLGGGVRADGNFNGTGTGPFITTGDIITNGNFSYTDNTPPTVGGNVIAGGTITDPHNTIPAAKKFPNTYPAPYTPPTLPAPIADFSSLPGPDVSGTADHDLAPGTYGDVHVGDYNTLTLHSGTYIMNSLSAGNGGKINIDLSAAPNQIKIFIQGQLGLSGDNVKINLTGGGGTAADVYWEVWGTGNNGGGNGLQFIGTLYAPYGAIKMSNDGSDVYGALYAGQSVTFGNSTTVNFVPVTVTGAPDLP